MSKGKKSENAIVTEMNNLKNRVEHLEKDGESGFDWQSDFEETRRCLLNYAHSSIQTHAGYLIAVVIGTLTLISRWDVFFNLPQEPVTPLVTIAFFLIIGAITAVTIYIIQRVLYWGTYHSTLLTLKINDAIELFRKFEGNPKLDVSGIPCSNVLNGVVCQHIEDTRNNTKKNDKAKKPKDSWLHKKTIDFSVMKQSRITLISFTIGVITALILLSFYVALTY